MERFIFGLEVFAFDMCAMLPFEKGMEGGKTTAFYILIERRHDFCVEDCEVHRMCISHP